MRMVARSGAIWDLVGDLRTNIDDLAWGISHIPRYHGQVQEFYSVGDHSIRVSEMVRPDLAYQALMHDIHEACTQDVSGPVKAALRLYGDAWDRFEQDVARKIRKWYCLPYRLHSEVKKADIEIRESEMRDLFSPVAQDACAALGCKVARPNETRRIFPRTAEESYEDFMVLYRRVGVGI